MSPVLIGFSIYLMVVLAVGGLTWRLNRSQADFFLAGRRLNPWVATFSERASGESAWLLLGLPGAAMAVGLLQSWTALGCVLGIAFAWWVLAAPLRRETERCGTLTLPDYLATRFAEHGQAIRLVASCIVIFFYTFYVAAQFGGAGKALLVTFAIPEQWGILLGAVVIVLYTMMGGFFAVAWTDLVQALLMFATLVILPAVGLWEITERGLSLTDALQGAGSAASWTGGKSSLLAASAVIGGLSWGLGYAGQPHTLTRFMSFRDPARIRQARIVAMAWAVPAFAGAMLIGLVGLTLHGQGHFDDVERLMPTLAGELLPGWLAGILISGAVAAMMSTADSQLLVCASAVSEDLVHRSAGIKLAGNRLVLVSRLVTLGIGVAAFALALFSTELIFTLVSYAWSGLGASFGPALILTLHWRRTSGAGVLAGMLTGAVSTVAWSRWEVLDAMISVRLVAFVLATVAVIVFSLLVPNRTRV